MRELQRVHLNGLRALEAVGRLGSLRAASEELGVSPGAVSQQVIKTERQIGRAVFDRTAQGLSPTPFGTVLLERLSAGFRELDRAVALARGGPDDVLTISVAPVLASKWLVPRLARYSRLHPGMRVRLDASSAIVDPDASEVDLAIRVGAGNWPKVKAEFLLPQEVFPVCSPALAERLGAPRDLLDVPVVRDANSNLSWDLWLAPLGLSERDLKPGDTFTDAALCLDAAIAGQGVMLAWQTLAHSALAAGTVVAPFPERAESGYAYWAVTSAIRTEPRKVSDFKRWLRQEIEATARDFEA